MVAEMLMSRFGWLSLLVALGGESAKSKADRHRHTQTHAVAAQRHISCLLIMHVRPVPAASNPVAASEYSLSLRDPEFL